MLFQPGKIAAASRLCWERGVALVVVGFPATPLMTARARICISAAHSRADLEHALQARPPTLPTLSVRTQQGHARVPMGVAVAALMCRPAGPRGTRQRGSRQRARVGAREHGCARGAPVDPGAQRAAARPATGRAG
jgi:hypothetical protein